MLIVLYVAILAVVGCGCAPTANSANDSNNAALTVTGGENASSSTTGQTAGASADPKESAATTDVTTDNPSQSSKAHPLDSYVSAAIISYNKDKYLGGEDQQFATEYHDTVKTVEQNDKTTVYAVALYAQYKQTNNEPKLTGANCIPVALTFQKEADGTYAQTEYWEAPDNSDEKSLQEKFPADAAKKAYQVLNGKSDGMKICDLKAKAFFSEKSNTK